MNKIVLKKGWSGCGGGQRSGKGDGGRFRSWEGRLSNFRKPARKGLNRLCCGTRPLGRFASNGLKQSSHYCVPAFLPLPGCRRLPSSWPTKVGHLLLKPPAPASFASRAAPPRRETACRQHQNSLRLLRRELRYPLPLAFTQFCCNFVSYTQNDETATKMPRLPKGHRRIKNNGTKESWHPKRPPKRRQTKNSDI